MGNKLARTTQVSPSEYYLNDLPSEFNLVLKETLGSDRFFKTILCVHDEGLLLVKVYFKRGESLDLREHARKLNDIREKLRNIENSHVWPFQRWHETEKAAYLLRQYVFNNLHERFSTCPSLSMIEKKWLAFQLLHAVKQSHDRGVCHGDIKCENVLVTSWNWIYLTDYASFKPTYIPDDNPADFSFFFDAGGRRRCYLAPERFYDPKTESAGSLDAPLRPSMDMFSVGCVIAELFLEGQALFDLSQLLAYRKKQYDPKPSLEKVTDVGIRNMILQMIHLNPESRLSCNEYLDAWAYDVFPSYFSPALHKLFSCLPVLESDARVAVIHGAFPEVRKQMIRDAKVKALSAEKPDRAGPPLPSNVSQRRFWPGSGGSSQDLMADINSLLNTETQQVQRRQNEDERASFGCATRLKAAALKMSEVSSMHEDFTEEVYENCLREPDGVFGDGFYTPDPVDNYKFSGKTCRKEDFTLPSEGGWAWESDWEIDYKWTTADPEGWRYCRFNTLEDGRQIPSAWTSLCTYDCLWKQRRWTRKRRKGFCQLQLPGGRGGRKAPGSPSSEPEIRCEGMVLVASALCSCMRNVKHPLTRREAVQLLHDASLLCDDDARLQLVVPFVAVMLSDPAAIVRCAALQTLCNVLSVVRSFSPSDSKVFPEYIFPLLSMLPDDPEESVRVCYASCVHKLAAAAQRFLRTGVASVGKSGADKSRAAVRYEQELAQLRETIGRVIQELVMGQKQTPSIRRALLQHIAPLCEFFGRKQCNDFLLPVLPAFLNDREKQLRALFFEQIVHVCVFVGEASSEAYLLPYVEQALNNSDEVVIVNALECIAALCVHRLLKKRVLLKTVERASPLLCHPNHSVRRAAITLVAASGSNLHPTDAYAYLIPILSPFLLREPLFISSEAALLACLKPPVSREVFKQVLSDVMDSLTSPTPSTSSKQHQQQLPHQQRVPRSPRSPGSGSGAPPPGKLQLQESGGQEVRAMEGYLRYSTMQQQWDTDPPEKLDASTAAEASGDGVIPLYSHSRSHLDRRLESSHIEGINRHSGGGLDTLGYSQWTAPDVAGDRSMITFPRYLSGYNGAPPPGSRRGDGGQQFLGSSVSFMPFKPAALDANAKDSSAGSNEVSQDAFVNSLKMEFESGWRPQGVLIAHLQEHQRAVNQVAVSSDNILFASGSDDGLVKVWDCRKLERDTSFKSKMSYSFEDQRVLRLAMLTPDHQIAASTSGGEIHVFCVGYTPRSGSSPEKYSAGSNIRKIEAHEGSVSTLQSFNSEGVSMLVYSTQWSGVHLWDFRKSANAWSLKGKLEQGYISALVVDPARNWIVSGSSRGVLTLWDLRFLIPIHSFQLPSFHPVEAMVIPTFRVLPRPFVYVAAGREELGIWNMDNGSCQQLLKTNGHDLGSLAPSLPNWRRNMNPRPRQAHEGTKPPDYRVDELNDPPARVPGIRALLPCGGSVITGGTDCRVRFWNHFRPETSYCVCGPTVKNAGPFRYIARKVSGVHVTQESGIKLPVKENGGGSASEAGVAAVDSAGCHRDSITSLASADTSQKLLISSSRDGVIKVWK